MKCTILHESRGRMRIRVCAFRMTMAKADKLQYYLQSLPFVHKAKVDERTMDATIFYEREEREPLICALSEFCFEETKVSVPENTGRALSREYEEKLFFMIAGRIARRILFPVSARNVITVCRAGRYMRRGLRLLRRGRMEVPVLDAAVIAASLLTGDLGTARTVMFLLKVGELLEEWTHKKSIDDLAQRMYLNVDQAWVRTKDGAEVLLPVDQIKAGDLCIVRMGNMVPLDGMVLSGEAMVNQSSMTGESLPVKKEVGSLVYAGTVLEEGELCYTVKHAAGAGRYDRIIRMIEESEKLKSETESRASHLADSLVPWSLGGTGLIYLLTGNVMKAMAILTVDFSCALKLAMPISVLSAMGECSDYKISVKGGKFLEQVAEAKTIVFDKTGTLTHAEPKVRKVVPFGGNKEREMLRLGACLEEHFPHSIANAVVKEAKRRRLRHEEEHSKVEYIVAHGIASAVGEKRVLIGSRHFIFDDEHVTVPEGEEKKLARLPADCSHLYLSIDGRLAAVILIEDPVREEAAEVIEDLHALGVDRVVMMTGDSRMTAKAVAESLGIDEYYAEVLPEDKAAFVASEQAAGRGVIMIGDGVNDSPALSQADVGVAISAGAAIAREIADITISVDDLHELVILRRIAEALMARINRNYRRIMAFNGGLIGLGVAGVLPAATTALLHNISTIYFSFDSTTKLLK